MLDFKKSIFQLSLQNNIFVNNQNVIIIDFMFILTITHIYFWVFVIFKFINSISIKFWIKEIFKKKQP